MLPLPALIMEFGAASNTPRRRALHGMTGRPVKPGLPERPDDCRDYANRQRDEEDEELNG